MIELLLAAVKTAGQDCNLWNTKRYFQGATPESVTACLGAGSNPREKDAAGITPLHRAARYNENPAVTQILLDAGADVEARDVGGFTPLRWVVNERFWDPGGNENLAVIQALLDVGADPEAQDDDGDTLLHVAIREVRRAYNRMNRGSHYPAVIQMLLDAGADPEARHRHGCPPLHLVAGDDEIPTVVTEALLAAGANPKMKDDSDRTPLHMAAGSHSNPEVIQALLAAGADLEARDDEGRTPLHMAAGRYSNPEVIQALLAAGADLEARDDEGDTPLHRVAAYTHSYDHRNVVATVMALLATGANPLARNGVGNTPWDLAQANEKLKGSDAYWRLKKVLLEAPGEGARRSATTSPEPAGNVGVPAGVPACQIPNYPNPPGGVANLGFSWCPASIGMQVRAFALQAAGAQCAIATESSSTPEQIEARQREIKAACDRLASLGQGNCQCPPGLAQ